MTAGGHRDRAEGVLELLAKSFEAPLGPAPVGAAASRPTGRCSGVTRLPPGRRSSVARARRSGVVRKSGAHTHTQERAGSERAQQRSDGIHACARAVLRLGTSGDLALWASALQGRLWCREDGADVRRGPPLKMSGDSAPSAPPYPNVPVAPVFVQLRALRHRFGGPRSLAGRRAHCPHSPPSCGGPGRDTPQA